MHAINMLHLLPFRALIKTLLAGTALAVLVATTAGWLGSGSLLQQTVIVLRWLGTVDFAIVMLIFVGWRYVPFAQRYIFPYLGGTWTGTIHYQRDGAARQKQATLQIHQSLLRVRLLLETDESESHTLIVYPQRDADFQRFRLYYVYENRTKEGQEQRRPSYRGIAIVRVELKPKFVLAGDYFTEQNGVGTVLFTRRRP